MRQTPYPPCFRVLVTLSLLVGIGTCGCAGREHPFRLTSVPFLKSGGQRDAENGKTPVEKPTLAEREEEDGDPPLPSSLVSPTDGAPERQAFDTARQVRPLTMSDPPDAFVPQSGKYPVPEGITEQESVALRQGLPSEPPRDAETPDSTSAAMAVAIGGENPTSDPVVAPARSLTKMLATSPSANPTPEELSHSMVNGGMPNPMAGLSETPIRADYARVDPRTVRAPENLPGTADTGYMVAAPATALSAISPVGPAPTDTPTPEPTATTRPAIGTDSATPGATPTMVASSGTAPATTAPATMTPVPGTTPVTSPTTGAILFAGAAERFGTNPVTPVTADVATGSLSAVVPVPVRGVPDATPASGTTTTPIPTPIPAPTSTPASTTIALTPLVPATTPTASVATPAKVTTPFGAGRSNFRPGSTRTATLPITGIATPIPVVPETGAPLISANATDDTAERTAITPGATTEVLFTDPSSPRTTPTTTPLTTSISLAPASDRFMR
ncbi:MAG: hypothetical protein Q4C47_04755 [Planctomycetia bacterium]|nr:hypothetical protein [Planctomycetia bacterium]